MNDSERDGLVAQFVDCCEYLNRQFYLGRVDMMEGLDMSIPQVKALMVLERNGPMRMSNLAIVLGRAMSAATSIVDRLVEKELILRKSDPNDRRLVICEITPQGAEAIAKAWTIGQERLVMVSEMMDDEQLAAAVAGLGMIRDADMEIQRTIAEVHPDVLPYKY